MSKRLLNLCLTALLSLVCTAAWAQSKVGDVYQISSAADFNAFAELVNDGEVHAQAVLTADIDLGSSVTQIGTSANKFCGTFDGAGHCITINLYGDDNKEGTSSIFGETGYGSLIENLKVQGTITTTSKLAAGIAARSSSVIRGCYVDIVINSGVNGDGTHAGMVAVANRGSMFENCLSKVTIKGASTSNCGGLVAWSEGDGFHIANCLVINDDSEFKIDGGSGSLARRNDQLKYFDSNKLSEYIKNIYDHQDGACSNNYATAQWGNKNNSCTVLTREDLKDGKICFQLNNDQSVIAWKQTIGEDPYPVPAAFGGQQVYADGATNCAGKGEGLTYSNNGIVQATAHDFDKFGICHECGCFNYTALQRDPADGYYLINNQADFELAEGLNRVQSGGGFHIKLTQDVDFQCEPTYGIFNTGNWYRGSFNGQGHTLKIAMTEMGSNASVFPNFAGDKLENVYLTGSIETTGQYAGSVTSHTREDRVHISNVISDVEIITTHSGDNTTGGLIGVVESKTWVDNAIYAGNINGVDGVTEKFGGFAGWSSNNLYVTNSAFLGTINNPGNDSWIVSRNDGNVSCVNFYWLPCDGLSPHYNGTVEIEDPEAIESGELAFLLNGSQGGLDRFYQKIGEDLMPSPIKKEGALVYASASEFRCDGQPMGGTTYSNEKVDPVLPDHQYEEGFCTECGGLQEDYMTPVDGWYEIGTPEQLVWWSHFVNKHLGCNARLTDDIDMDGYSDDFALIGTQDAPFYGNFDGQYHTISNLYIDHDQKGVGFIACINSLPKKNTTVDGKAISDDEARKAEGNYVKNLTLDESCEIIGNHYVGLIGNTANWAGHVTFEGIMMKGNVIATAQNAGGILGCVDGSTCAVTINRCGMIGRADGGKESSSFSGWLGSYATVTNCFAVGEVTGYDSDDRYFARYGSATITNCYAKYGTQVPTVTDEDFESGALAWKANGSQFRTPVWYQTIGEDLYPYADPSHGTVIYAAEQYFSVADEKEDLPDVIAQVQDYIHTDLDEAVATKSLVDECLEMVDALEDVTTLAGLADAFDALSEKEKEVKANEALYAAYKAEAEKALAFLDANEGMIGEISKELRAYLEETEEPDEVNTLGSAPYILENHTATGEEIEAETKRVSEWLAEAIHVDYVAGTDVTFLFANADFSKGTTAGWEGELATGTGRVHSGDEDLDKTIGVEAWNKIGAMSQTVEGLKPGYYLVGINGAFRPSNDRYSYNYAAGIAANGNFNYFPTVVEEIVALEEIEDQVNVYLEGEGAHDLKIWSDHLTTDDGKAEEAGLELEGYAVHGPGGMAAAANADRYQVYTIAQVDEEGKLTIEISNLGTKYDSDWTGWSNLNVTYLGQEADEEAIAMVVENMQERANTILNNYEGDLDPKGYKKNPCYPAALKEELTAALDAESSMATVEKFSEIFQGIHAGKEAYKHLYATSLALQAAEAANLNLAEYDEEGGLWYATEETLFTDEEVDAMYEGYTELTEAYAEGTMSTEEAANVVVEGLGAVLPEVDEEGNFLIATPKHLAFFRGAASADYHTSAKLVADIDMSGIAMQPINEWDNSYRGTFDGQGYAIANVWIEFTDAEHGRCGLFNTLDHAVIKNLKVNGEYYSDGKFMAGITGYTYGATIQNCDVDVKLHSTVSGDGTHGGVVGNNAGDDTVVENCIVRTEILCPVNEETGNPITANCGGVIGWSGSKATVRNCLILTQAQKGILEEMVSRNGDNCTRSENYSPETLTGIAGSQATKVSAEQLASGEITYKLNNSKSDETCLWFQTIGQDAMPQLFDGAVVYYYGGKFINDTPDPQLNAFAYDVRILKGGVKYTLNATAKTVKAILSDGTEQTIATDQKAGTYTAQVEGEVAFVEVEGAGSLDVLKVGESLKVLSPYGMDINNNPASKNFGQILMTETRPLTDHAGMITEDNPGALFTFDPKFEDVTGAYYGGLEFKAPLVISSDYQFGFKDIRFSKDGRLFVGNASGETNSSIYEIDPENLAADFTPIFQGGELDAKTGITYVGEEEQNRMAVGLALEGEGEDLKLYVLGAQRSDGNFNTTDYNCSVYNLGTAKAWTEAPSANYEALDGVYTIAPGHVGIHEDGRGGLWYNQYRETPSETLPAIKHWDAEGNLTYSDVKTNTKGGKMASTADGNYFAMSMGGNKVVVYETNYVPTPTGNIWLEPKTDVATTESQVTAMAFDVAGNLYVASSATKTISRYTVPAIAPKSVRTPAIFQGGVIGDVNGDGVVTIQDVVAVLEVMAADSNDPAADVNGDKAVTIQDVVAVLEIMAAQ